MNIERLTRYIDTAWDQSIVPALSEYIRIPNKSVHFDPQWELHGHMQRAADLMKAWCEKHALPGMKIEIVRLPGLTPLLYIEVPGSGGVASSKDCVLLYGRSEEHTSELQSQSNLVCRLLLEKKKKPVFSLMTPYSGSH